MGLGQNRRGGEGKEVASLLLKLRRNFRVPLCPSEEIGVREGNLRGLFAFQEWISCPGEHETSFRVRSQGEGTGRKT